MTAACARMIKGLIILPGVLLSLFAGAGEVIRPAVRERDLDRVIHEMERVRSGIEDLEAVVDRITLSGPGGSEAVTRIRLAFKGPDKMNTRVEGGREVWIDGDRMWIYSPEIKVVEAYHLKDPRAAIHEMSWGLTSPIRVLLRGTNRSAIRLDDGTYLVTVIPDQAEAEVEKIQAWVNPQTWLIARMAIHPRSGSPVELKIGEWTINSGLPDSRFEFRLPEGAELFEPLETGGEIIQ